MGSLGRRTITIGTRPQACPLLNPLEPTAMHQASVIKLRSPLLAFATIAAIGTSSLGAQSLIAYGKGTPGSGGKTPQLWASSTPRPGNAKFGLTIEQGFPNTTAVGFLSLKKANFNLGGVGILIDFGLSFQLPFLTLDSAGAGAYKLPLPNSSSVLGAQVYQQVFIADAGGAALGFSATQGLDLTVVNFGVLLGLRSTGSASPQIAINLDTGTQSSFTHTSMTNVAIADMYPGSRAWCMMGSGRSNKVALFDCDAFPPKFVKEFGSSGTPWAITWNPDGIRAYIVNQTAATGTPEIQVVWGLPGLNNFGQAYPGGNIPLGTTIDAMRMEFTSTGNIGMLGTLGLFSGGGELRKYDTRIGSSNYHKQIAKYHTLGKYQWEMCRIDDDTFAIAVSGLGTQVHVELIDINTMKRKASMGVTAFGAVVRGMVAGPRGRYLYIGNSPASRWNVPAGVVRINIDPKDTNYGKFVNINAGFSATWSAYDVEITDAGDRLYAIIGTGIQTNFVGKIVEYDTTTLQVTRSWNMNRLGNMYNLVIR